MTPVKDKPVNMQLFPVAVILLAAFAVLKAQEYDEEALEQLMCSEEEVVRASVVQCISLIPDSHLEIIKTCDSRLAEIGNDYSKILDVYCSSTETFEESDRCVSEAYRVKGQSEMEPIRPVAECLQSMITSK